MNNSYKPFDTFILRTPLFPFNFVNKCLSLEQATIFYNALYLASPELYNELAKNSFALKSVKENETYYKYYTRACSRCTPFGLFAGCSVGHWGDKTKVTIGEIKSHEVFPRLDMDYLGKIVRNLERNASIRERMLFYPNQTLYKIGDSYRFVESFYLKNHRLHQISSIESDIYIEQILKKAANGSYFFDLVNLLISLDISKDDASDFINSLIDSQVLVSSIQQKVTGEDIYADLVEELKRITNVENAEKISEIINFVKKIDFFKPSAISLCNELINQIDTLHIDGTVNHLLQVDLKIKAEVELSSKIQHIIHDAISCLNKITPFHNHKFITDFINKFTQRYEQREIPILEALDPDIGIGFGKNIIKGTDDLIQQLFLIKDLPNDENLNQYSKLDKLLLTKYVDFFKFGADYVEITDNDLVGFEENWLDLPETFTVMANLFYNNNQNLEIYIKGVGGENALPPLARFCHLDDELLSLAKEISKKEEDLLSDFIVAEILYLPEAHLGNILLHPILYKYEIPYLTQSSVKKDFQISLSDIFVSVRNNTIYLRSKSLNKYIIPRLSSAHYYAGKCMPLYQFLCYLQLQNKRSPLYFSWGSLFEDMDFLPEVRYHNIILSRQSWLLKAKLLDLWASFLKQPDQLLLEVRRWKEENKVPRFVTFSEFDNDLLIDFGNYYSISAFLKIAKKHSRIRVEEVLYEKYSSISSNYNGSFCNDFIFPFYKSRV